MGKYALPIIIVLLLLALNWLQAQEQQDYTALMLVCGGTYDSSSLHLRQFGNEADAQAWADGEMQGVWDIAYIYNGYTPDGAMRLVLARSEGSCYPGMSQWTRFD